MGAQSPDAPETLKDASTALTTALRYALHSLQRIRRGDQKLADEVLASIRFQMAAATKVQEAIYGSILHVTPAAMRAFFIRDQLPRTIVPYANQFFRTGTGGSTLSGSEADGAEGTGCSPFQHGSHDAGGCVIYVGGNPTAGTPIPAQPQPQQQQPVQLIPQAATAQTPGHVALLGAAPAFQAAIQTPQQVTYAVAQPVVLEQAQTPLRFPFDTQQAPLQIQCAAPSFSPPPFSPVHAPTPTPWGFAAPVPPTAQGYGWGPSYPPFDFASSRSWPANPPSGPTTATHHGGVPGTRRGRGGGAARGKK